jgi:uncharacterized protein
MSDIHEFRRALIPVLASRSKGGYLGRTSLMKYMYLLQAVRGVPLGYRFTLYSYGPFDSNVLADLSVAEAFEAVESELELYQGGYGYRISPARNAKWLEKRYEKILKKYDKDVEWVIKNFGSFSSAELELVGTIIYVDREATGSRKKLGLNQVAKLVHEVKPHFSIDKVLQYARQLADESILQASA